MVTTSWRSEPVHAVARPRYTSPCPIDKPARDEVRRIRRRRRCSGHDGSCRTSASSCCGSPRNWMSISPTRRGLPTDPRRKLPAIGDGSRSFARCTSSSLSSPTIGHWRSGPPRSTARSGYLAARRTGSTGWNSIRAGVVRASDRSHSARSRCVRSSSGARWSYSPLCPHRDCWGFTANSAPRRKQFPVGLLRVDWYLSSSGEAR